MKRVALRTVRHVLMGKGNLEILLSDSFSTIDPYSASCGEFVSSAFDSEAAAGWERIRKFFTQVGEFAALENAWAAVDHMSDWTAFLYRGVELAATTLVKARASVLAEAAQAGWQNEPLIQCLADCRTNAAGSRAPDFLNIEGLNPQLRIRFGLANRVTKNASWAELIHAAAGVGGLSSHDAGIALTEAGIQQDAQDFKRLDFSEISRLSDREFEIISLAPNLLEQVISGNSVAPKRVVKEIAATRNAYAKRFRALSTVIRCIGAQDWKSAGETGQKISIDESTSFATTDLLAGRNPQNITLPNESHSGLKERWAPMCVQGYEKLDRIFKHKRVQRKWTLSANEIASQLIAGTFRGKALNEAELNLLNQTWSQATQKKLINARQYRYLDIEHKIWGTLSVDHVVQAAVVSKADGAKLLLREIPRFTNPKKILECLIVMNSAKANAMVSYAVDQHQENLARAANPKWGAKLPIRASWKFWISELIGTETWSRAVDLRIVEPAGIEQILSAVDRKVPQEKSERFQAEVVRVLLKDPPVTAQIAIEIIIWTARDPACLLYVGPNLPPKIRIEIGRLDEAECKFESLTAIYKHCAADSKLFFWNVLLKHVTLASDLAELMLDGANNGYQSVWQHRWKAVLGSETDRSRALALAARRDPRRLKKIRAQLGEDNICSALIWASRALPHRCRWDSLLSELIGNLGVRHGATLEWLLIQRNLNRESGTRLDHLYAKYEIPKKSGEMRLIFAPHDGLKRIQRAILTQLLNPLGAHDRAFGFLPGKSIVDNAAAHVGQEIVVNADVRNCFPSVRWPLILASLRRDLSNRLSPKAISALVDICTAQGALPIGAPTSPALLNRVLLKTDEILATQSSKRGCNYSRYADDLTFSGGESAVRMLGIAKHVLSGINLILDPAKTNIFRRGRRQMCTGLVVNDKVNVPRRVRRRIRASVHAMESGKVLHWDGTVSTPSALKGRLAFLHMVNATASEALEERFDIASKAKAKSNRKSRAK